MDQPHIATVGAFDPSVAFMQVSRPLQELIEGVKEKPDVLPPEEVLRAAQVGFDTLEAISQITCATLNHVLEQHLDSDAFSTHRILREAERSARSPEDKLKRQAELLSRVAITFPHEFTPGEGDDND